MAGTHQAAIVSLPASTKRLLGEALCCAGLSSPEAAAPYMAGLHGAISGGYQALLASAEFGAAVVSCDRLLASLKSASGF